MSLPQKRLMVFLFSPGQQVLPTSRRKLVLSVCLALVKPHQENCVQFWTPQYMRDMGNTGKSPTEAHQVDERLEYISCEESLRELVPFSLKKRRIRILNNCMKKYFVEILCRNTWGEGAKERETGSLLLLAAWTMDKKKVMGTNCLNTRKHFTVWIMKNRNRLSKEVVKSPLEVFKCCLNIILGNLL